MEPGRRGSLGLTSLSLKVPSGGGGGALTKQLSQSSTGLNVVRPDDLRRATLSKLALASSGGSSPKQGHRLLAPAYMHQRRNSDFLLKESIGCLATSKHHLEYEKQRSEENLMSRDFPEEAAPTPTNELPDRADDTMGPAAATAGAQPGPSWKHNASVKLSRVKQWINEKIGPEGGGGGSAEPYDPRKAASASLEQARNNVVSIEENIAQEEAELRNRALHLRRQSADAFKLMTEVKRFNQQKPTEDQIFEEDEEEEDQSCDEDNESNEEEANNNNRSTTSSSSRYRYRGRTAFVEGESEDCSISSVVGSVSPKQSDGSLEFDPSAVTAGSRDDDRHEEESEEEEEDIDKYFQAHLKRMSLAQPNQPQTTRPAGAGGNFQATRRHSLALALTGLKKRLNPSASAPTPGDATRTNPTTPTDDKSLPTAFKRLSLKAFSPSERRGSCTRVAPEEMLAMDNLDATRHRFGLDHLEKLDRIDDDDDYRTDDDDDVFTAEEETYNRRRFGGGPSPQDDGVTTDESVVSSSRHAESLGSNNGQSENEKAFAERKRRLLFEQTTVETIL